MSKNQVSSSRIKGFKRSCLSTLAAAALLSGSMPVLATQAAAGTAAPAPVAGGNLVTFGDSYMANPIPVEFMGAKARQAAEDSGIPLPPQINSELEKFSPYGCGQSQINTPRQIAAMKGMQLNDYSCPGAGVYADASLSKLDHQVDNALRDGALNDKTSHIVIQIGFNDSYQDLAQSVVTEGLPNVALNLDAHYAKQKTLWFEALNRSLDRIEASAPNAKVFISDYPTISEPNTAGQCLLHVEMIPGNIGIPVFWIKDAETNVHQWAEELANNRNLGFVNLRDSTINRHECAPDSEREIAGVIDTTNQSGFNLPVHMTNNGVTRMAHLMAEKM